MFATLDRTGSAAGWSVVEPDDPERYVWLDDLDASDPAVSDDVLYGHAESWQAFLDALGPDGLPGADASGGSSLVDLAPGAELAAGCEAAAGTVERLSDAEQLELVEAAERLARWASGLRARVIAAYADRHPAGSSAVPPGGSVASAVSRWVPDELGMTLHVSRLEAQSLIASAQRLAHVLPDTLDALQAGRIDERRADTLSYATRTLPDEKARAVEATVLAKADGATHRQVYDRTRRAVHRVDPDGEYRRHQVARTERRVTMQPREEGMASLWAFGPAAECEATFTMLTRLAQSLGAGDPRTLDQRRFDLLGQVVQGRITVTDLADLDALLVAARELSDSTGPNGPGGEAGADGHGADDPDADGIPVGSGPAPVPPTDETLVAIAVAALARRPQVADTVRKPLIQVVVGLDTLLGSDRPAELIGHGPIPAVTARALAAGGSLARMVTDPVTGRLLDYGRTTYAPPAALADFVRARDQMCRGPGCSCRLRELDHRQRWDRDGHTADVNLDGYCRSHHVLKELDGWHVLPHADGRLTWVSPAGRSHTTEPYDYRPFTDDVPDADADRSPVLHCEGQADPQLDPPF